MKNNLSDLKKGIIYYFSGTGNTAYIVSRYLSLFSNKDIKIEVRKIEDIKSNVSLRDYDFLVIAFPVYAFSAPDIVTNFVKNLPKTNNKKAIVISNAAALNGSSSFKIRKILDKKNYDVLGNLNYYMPHNAVNIFSKEIKTKNNKKDLEKIDFKIKNTYNKINLDFNNIYNNKRILYNPNIFYRLFSSISNCFYKFFFKNKNKWVVDKNKCIYCGLCERICPTNNITVKKKKREVKFSNKCIFCLRCYNFCPTNAITYKGKKTNIQYNKFKDLIVKNE